MAAWQARRPGTDDEQPAVAGASDAAPALDETAWTGEPSSASLPVLGFSMQTEPPVEAHAPDALLVTRQAEADRLGVPGASLSDELRVGDLASYDPHEIALPSDRARSACKGSLNRPTPTTGSDTASRIPDEMKPAYPGGTCMEASIMNSDAVATPIEVLM